MKLFAALLAAAALLPSTAYAQPRIVERSLAIPIAGIPLTDPAQVAGLRARIARAARQVCADDDRSFSAWHETRRCTRVAVEDANRQLDRLVNRSHRMTASADRRR